MKNKVVLTIALTFFMLGSTTNTLAEDTPSATTKTETTSTEKVSKEAPDVAKKSEQEKAPEPKKVKVMTKPIEKTVYDFSGVNSLRGNNGLKEMALPTKSKQLPADRAPIERNYFQQPPLVPHRVREYQITINNNKCLACHSWKTYQKSGATKISQTHFEDREGNAQSTVAARRYFCNQCHVPQVDAKPLVENEFKPVDDLK